MEIKMNEFKDIEELLKNTPVIEPSREAKNIAISNALEVFDKKSSKSFQGISISDRLIDRAYRFYNLLTGEWFMKKAYIVVGSLCIGIIATSLVYTGYFEKVIPLKEEIKPAEFRAVQPQPTDALVLPPSPSPSPPPAQKFLSKEAGKLSDTRAITSESADRAKVGINAKIHQNRGVPTNNNKLLGDVLREPSHAQPYYPGGRDKFQTIKDNPIKLAKDEPVSTFSIDVDTASYSFVRTSLNSMGLPNKDAVRVEEMINYFPYEYPVPENKSEPFKATASVFPTPWNKETKLLHIAIKGYQIDKKEKPKANLVFLIDTSGSMNQPNRLPLVKNSLKLLLNNLRADDKVAIVTYAGHAGTVLEPTSVKEKAKIANAIDNLNAGGSTAGAEGIRQAYLLAERSMDKEAVNRVILATDGDFNVGITDPKELKSFIEKKRETGVFLSVLGFGMGNYNDELMQALAQNGNGNAAYIDNLNEAAKVLVSEATSVLFPIAKDVKIQVEFNPNQIAEYRLIGYETRLLNREDFNNDKIDAGDIGAGHSVTAIYEITPRESKSRLIDDLRYQPSVAKDNKSNNQEYAFIKIRYKLPDSTVSKLMTSPIDKNNEFKDLSQISKEAKFAVSVAAFGQMLRGDSYTKEFTFDDAILLAESAKGEDKFGYRAEFINLVKLAKNIVDIKNPYQEPIYE